MCIKAVLADVLSLPSMLPKVMSKFLNSTLQKVLPGLVSPILLPSWFPGDDLLLFLTTS